MIGFPAGVRVHLAVEPHDMRKSFNGLTALARELVSRGLEDGAMFAFTNKRRNLAKIYFFDRTGQAILFKRLSRGRYQLPIVQDGAARVEVYPAQLTMMLEGIDLRSVVRRKRYTRPTPPTPHP